MPPLRYSLARTAAATNALMTLADAKAHLRVDIADDDALITALISAVTDAIEGYTHRALITSTWRMSFDYFPSHLPRQQFVSIDRAFFQGQPWGYLLEPIKLPRPNLQAVSSIKYLDLTGAQQTLDPATYVVDADGLPGQITLAYNQSWPNALVQHNAIQILYTAGFGDTAANVPNAIIAAAKLLLGHLYAMRESHVTGATITENPALCALLAPYVYREAA